MWSVLPPLLVHFAVTVILSFVLGLELHGYRRAQDEGIGFGTTRTLTLIGASGFVLWTLGGVGPSALYLAGFAALAVWLAVDQWLAHTAAPDNQGVALLPALVALISYALGPLVLQTPDWFVAAVVIVTILMMAEKPLIRRLSDAFPSVEGVTLAKFLIIAGLVLPLIPDTPLPGLPELTYDKVWLAVVAISGLSYLGYLLHRFVFPDAGTLLTGLLGGLYSSTVATVVLARQARTDAAVAAQAPAAVVLASLMMYLRLFVLILVLGHTDAARRLAAPFALLVLGSAAVTAVLWHLGRSSETATKVTPSLGPRNPLDLPIALLFAALFVIFAAITQFADIHYGADGLRLLSFVTGLTDIDPFILSLLAGRGAMPEGVVIGAILIASGSNNLVKAVYAQALSRRSRMLPATIWLALTFAMSLAWAFWAG